MLRSGLLSLLGIVLLGGCFLAGAFLGEKVLPKRGKMISGSTNASSSKIVSSLGKLVPEGGLVAIVGPLGDRIEKIPVKAGTFVEAKSALVQLASHRDRHEEVTLLEIQFEEAERQRTAITAARNAKLAEIDQQGKSLDVTNEAESVVQKLKLDYLDKQLATARSRQDRVEGLDRSKIEIGAQEREQLALAVAQAKSEFDAAKNGSEATKKKHVLQKQAAQAQRASAEAEMDLALLRVPIDSLKKNLALAKLREERAMLTAPVSGTVAQIVGNAGDPTGGGPILYLAAGKGMVVVAEVYATDIHKIRSAKDLAEIKVEVKGPALGENVVLTGSISGEDAIGRSVARNNVVGFSPRSDTDRRIAPLRPRVLDNLLRRADAERTGGHAAQAG